MSRHKILIMADEDLGASIAEIFDAIGPQDLKNKRVLVKPNMLRPARPDECVVTDPAIISETVAHLLAAGADVVVGDNPMPDRKYPHETDVAAYCGYINASQQRFKNIGKYSKKVKRGKNLLKEFYFSSEVYDCDLIVSLPKYKTHDLTAMTLSVKNHFGLIPGGFKPYVHSLFPGIADFSRVLVEIYETRPPDMIIMDCLRIIDAKGTKFSPGKLIAGDNGHAVDYACALMAGIDPLRIPTVRIALDEGLFDPAGIEYVGRLEKIRDFSLPFVFPFRNSVVEFVSRVLYKIWLGRVPIIDHQLCTKCSSCENVCPPRAVRNQHIDYGKCIKCYCCVEVCPVRAIRIKFKVI